MYKCMFLNIKNIGVSKTETGSICVTRNVNSTQMLSTYSYKLSFGMYKYLSLIHIWIVVLVSANSSRYTSNSASACTCSSRETAALSCGIFSVP